MSGSVAVHVWNNRQRARHQYTPAVPTELALEYDAVIGLDRTFRSGRESAADMRSPIASGFAAHLLETLPSNELPHFGSARRLRQDVRHHQASSSSNSFAPKITSLPPPEVVRAQEEFLRREGRRHTSHREFVKEKMAHRRGLHGVGYTLDVEL